MGLLTPPWTLCFASLSFVGDLVHVGDLALWGSNPNKGSQTLLQANEGVFEP